jgi:hypothetical protein
MKNSNTKIGRQCTCMFHNIETLICWKKKWKGNKQERHGFSFRWLYAIPYWQYQTFPYIYICFMISNKNFKIMVISYFYYIHY